MSFDGPTTTSKEKDNENNNHEKDFVIREGFPALYVPESNFSQPWLDDDEPIPPPLLPFASFQNAVDITPQHLSTLWKDCELVFTARTKETHEAYSFGATFFVPCVMKPRCALEGLAKLIFDQHTQHLPLGIFKPECSGAEWWTLILEQDENDDEEDNDDVGMHFDADYGLEEQVKNLMIHPRLSTVTYLTDVGVPTLVLDEKSPTNNNTASSLNGNVERSWLSSPSIGKHISFDGRLLHGAPGAFFPAASNPRKQQQQQTQPFDAEIHSTSKMNKKSKMTEDKQIIISEDNSVTFTTSNKRITFLVNIWLNHCPLDAELLDQDVCDQLQTPWNSTTTEDVVSLLGDKRKKQDQDDNNTVVFQWIATTTVPDDIPTVTLEAATNNKVKKMICEETTLCHHNVTFALLCSSAASKEVATKVGVDGSSVQIQFQKDAFQIIVGDECYSEDDEEDDETRS